MAQSQGQRQPHPPRPLGELARRAILASQGLAAGCKLAIGSDAHAPEHFDFLRFGVLTARRGWVEMSDLANPAGLGAESSSL
jgi:histidinol phosphatase-like PHP family hydrolase